MNHDEIVRVADEILGRELKKAGYDHADVASGLDHEDEPALFIVAYLTNSNEKNNGSLYSNAHVSLRERLRDLGEARFPYLSFRFKGDVEALEEASSLFDDGQ
jgi:hypothetical protein